ncbi:ThuA domain-containing protein [Phenylobacterium sp.]|uniref:ThuA domain-containing protein n=1 Tax=Phenylobacterium sp. TaxID=1871053 RepID=UPI00286B2309|nr:ThuA domain-containing protein [Phenylobacterium sp.]
MPAIRYGEPLRILVSVKGHPFDRNAFASVFEDMEGVQASFVDQPAAGRLMNPQGMAGFDALVLYDMPGIDFRAAGDRPGTVAPEGSVKAGLEALLTQGKGVVALHHAIAGWPDWPDYADWLGGRFLYKPAEVRGRPCLDSGYRHDVAYQAEAVTPAHPILGGVPAAFPMKDELYLYEVFEAEVQPLLRARHPFVRDGFYSAHSAVARGRMFSNEGWEHPAGSNLIGWTKRALNSPLVYLQPGDGPETYANPNFRRIVGNAIKWVASEATLAWARGA